LKIEISFCSRSLVGLAGLEVAPVARPAPDDLLLPRVDEVQDDRPDGNLVLDRLSSNAHAFP
jgi:hypothetical protein